MLEGALSWISGVADNSLYPVLFLQYVVSYLSGDVEDGDSSSSQIDLLQYNVLTRWLMLTAMIVLLSLLNYRGISIVSSTAMLICSLSMMPFFVLALWCLPLIDTRRWLAVPAGDMMGLKAVDWGQYLNVLFWNLNYWDSASLFSGEVRDPAKTFPRAMLYAMVMVVLAYFIPLLCGIGASDADWRDWDDGYFATVGR